MSRPSSSKAIRSIASWTRRSPLKSQLGPVNSGVPASTVGGAITVRASGTDAPFRKQFVEHREDLCRVADPPHRKMRVRGSHLVVGAPQIAVARQPTHAAAGTVADL